MATRLCTRAFWLKDRLYEVGKSYDVDLGPKYEKFFQGPDSAKKAPGAGNALGSPMPPKLDADADFSKPMALSQVPTFVDSEAILRMQSEVSKPAAPAPSQMVRPVATSGPNPVFLE
jgi:hypothetical protein